MEVDGVSLTMGGAAVSAIAGVVGAWIKAKYGKPVVPPVPQPLETERVGPYVTCGECKQHRAAIGKRIDGVETTSHAILRKLDEIDTRAETRSENLHRRLDPIIEKVADNSARVDMLDARIRDAANAATIGGNK